MSETKYQLDFPQRAKQYAREGMIDTQIAKALGVSCNTLYKYKAKYPEFVEALREGKAPINSMVEDSLLQTALGYEYEEQTVEQKIEVDGDGKKKVISMTVKKTTKHARPDTRSATLWLQHRNKKRWGPIPEEGNTSTVDEVRELIQGMSSAPRYQLDKGEEK